MNLYEHIKDNQKNTSTKSLKEAMSDRLKGAREQKAGSESSVADEIIGFYTDKFNSDKYVAWLENFLTERINMGDRTYKFRNEFWSKASYGGSDTYFEVGYSRWENPEEANGGSWGKYKGVELSKIAKSVLDKANQLFLDLLKREGIKVLNTSEESNRFGDPSIYVNISLEDFDETIQESGSVEGAAKRKINRRKKNLEWLKSQVNEKPMSNLSTGDKKAIVKNIDNALSTYKESAENGNLFWDKLRNDLGEGAHVNTRGAGDAKILDADRGSDYILVKLSNAKYQPYIAAWAPEWYEDDKEGNLAWGQGHYFSDEKSAREYFEEKSGGRHWNIKESCKGKKKLKEAEGSIELPKEVTDELEADQHNIYQAGVNEMCFSSYGSYEDIEESFNGGPATQKFARECKEKGIPVEQVLKALDAKAQQVVVWAATNIADGQDDEYINSLKPVKESCKGKKNRKAIKEEERPALKLSDKYVEISVPKGSITAGPSIAREINSKRPNKKIVKRVDNEGKELNESIYELSSQYGGRNSYYGKAQVEVNNGEQTLYSYGTPIMKIKDNGEMEMLCDHWALTNTTIRHIREFMQQNGLSPVPKKELDKLIDAKEEK